MTTPSIGDLVYLTSCLIEVGVSAIATPPDTPNQYTASLKVMSDQAFVVDPLAGGRGTAGQAYFPLRLMEDPVVNNPPVDLPTNLVNRPADIGKYWLVDVLDPEGHVINELAWVWYGDRWRVVQMGERGQPGPVPDIHPIITQIDPDLPSHVITSGPSLEPTWDFNIASPRGLPAATVALHSFPDVNETSPAPALNDVLAFTGGYTSNDYPLWRPFSIEALMPQPFSMPEGSFVAYTGTAQRAAIGSFAVPPQNFPWTPIVWGHIGATGINLSSSPLMIGCEVRLGDPITGTLVARGLGSALGTVNIMPHYSAPSSSTTSITPGNQRAVVPANHTVPQGTVYINLYNEAKLGEYSFTPADAQLFVMCLPFEPTFPAIITRYPPISGRGQLRATARRV